MKTKLNQIIDILDRDGLDDALIALGQAHEKEMRLYAVWSARQVQHLMKDKRSIAALDVAERYANGLATDKELAAALDAAWAASDAASAAWAAWSAAGSAVWAAAGNAVAAASAARAAAGSAAGSAARAAQEKRLSEVCAEIDAAIEQQN